MNQPVNKRMFKRTLLALALSSASGALMAQDTIENDRPSESEAVLEEVIVTGIRASMEDALNTKREADQIVDAISTEDIGKLPDDNIGEALQRITGVSLDREAGEGKGVSIRGLGAGLSMVTINGQQMASTEGTRAVNFSDLMPALFPNWKSGRAQWQDRMRVQLVERSISSLVGL